jgi:bacteriocin biosynthesis cyclodehydratase domain-containing protein
MTGASKNISALLNSKKIPQFAPNLSVYVQAPNVVCLYSETRKFFLHGELYCALAAVIGKGGHSFRELAHELERQFPPDKIEEALKRLVERRYIVSTSPSSDSLAAAYWASLGLLPEFSETNLKKTSVRIQCIDVQGAKELGGALKNFGVRVVNRSPELTVTLVSDYLDERLAMVNDEHLVSGKRWLIAQPSGTVPLVGPVLDPHKGACWRCLTDRLLRNREIKGFLNRAKFRCIAESPLAHQAVGQGAIQLAAAEIAKAIATAFRTNLSNNIISFDLGGSIIERHHVARRPQCPSCGSPKLRDPHRPAVPFELGPGAKLIATSGGYRTVASRSTVQRFRKHISPLTGVVSRLERIDADVPLNTNFYAQHNFSAPALSVDQLRAGLSGGSFGKGSTAEQGEASALMEAIERYSGIFQGDEIRRLGRFTDFPKGDAIHPNDVQLFSDRQFRQSPGDPTSHEHLVPPVFDPSAEIEWSPVWSLRDRRFRYLPTSLLYFFYSGPGHLPSDTNGCAAGNTREEAIVQGFLELVERDAYATWWYNRVPRPAVDLSRFNDYYVSDLQTQLADAGRRLWVLDVTNDLGIPTFVAMAHWMDEGRESMEFGSGAHFDSRIALLRALTELNQFLSIGVMGGGKSDKSTLDGITPLLLENYPYLTPNGDTPRQSNFGAEFGHLDTREQVLACVDMAKRAGLDFLVLDHTRPDIDVPVVRVVVPGLRHFYRRFAPGRLYDVPVKLGWLAKPTLESDLNPVHPHT